MQWSLEKSLKNYGLSGKCLILLRSAYTVEINFNYFLILVPKNTLFYVPIYIGVVFIYSLRSSTVYGVQVLTLKI
jgi:hypothetical protein